MDALSTKITNLDSSKLDKTTYNSGYSTLENLIKTAQSTANGKCGIEYGSYTGNGTVTKTISTSKGMPYAIVIQAGTSIITFVGFRGNSYIQKWDRFSNYDPNSISISFSSSSITLSYSGNGEAYVVSERILNQQSTKYYYLYWYK